MRNRWTSHVERRVHRQTRIGTVCACRFPCELLFAALPTVRPGAPDPMQGRRHVRLGFGYGKLVATTR